jgi:hypothetical protein
MSINVTARAYMQVVRTAAKTLGVPLPKPFTADLDRATALIAEAEAISASGEQLTAAVLTAIEAGRDYHADDNVGRLLLDHVLVSQNIGGAARDRTNHDIQVALVEHADTILSGWAEALDPHSAALAAAAQALPTADLDDAKAIAARGVEPMRHWANAQDALKKWQAATAGFGAIATAAHITFSDKHLIMSPADAVTLTPVISKRADPWLLARHGIPLRLASLADYMERTASYEQQRHAAARRAHERHEEERSVLV